MTDGYGMGFSTELMVNENNMDENDFINIAEMDADMKSVIIVREFKDEKVYKSWLEHAEKLEDIDDQVTEQSMDVEPNWAYRFDNGDFKR